MKTIRRSVLSGCVKGRIGSFFLSPIQLPIPCGVSKNRRIGARATERATDLSLSWVGVLLLASRRRWGSCPSLGGFSSPPSSYSPPTRSKLFAPSAVPPLSLASWSFFLDRLIFMFRFSDRICCLLCGLELGFRALFSYGMVDLACSS